MITRREEGGEMTLGKRERERKREKKKMKDDLTGQILFTIGGWKSTTIIKCFKCLMFDDFFFVQDRSRKFILLFMDRVFLFVNY